MIKIETTGTWSRTRKFLSKAKRLKYPKLAKYGEAGVRALSSATPVDTGKTANLWYYTIDDDGQQVRLNWHNRNLSNDWFPVAIMLQYGHATGTGGWVEGRDYINPALRPIFDQLAKDAWKEVQNL